MYRVRIHEKLWMECDSPEEAVLLADALLDLNPQVTDQPMTVVEPDEEEPSIIEITALENTKDTQVNKLRTILENHPTGLRVADLAKVSGLTQSIVEAIVYHKHYKNQFVRVKEGGRSWFKLAPQPQTGT